MNLANYLKSEEEGVYAFAHRIDRAPSTVYRILAGQPPDWETINRINRATGGVVQANDFMVGAA